MKPASLISALRRLALRRLCCALWYPTLLVPLSLVGVSAAAQDDDDVLPQRLPGLIAEYVDQRSDIRFLRYEAQPAFELAAGESPDPRLAPAGWKVRWQGVIEILQPGKYRFSAATVGRVELAIDDRSIPLRVAAPSSPAADKPPAGEEPPVDLALGLHKIEIRYEPAANEPVRLSLGWQSDNFTQEPLPARALGHGAADPAVTDVFVRGRLLVEDHSCVVCHAPNDATPLARQLAKRPGPHLTKAGARLKPGWIYHWLANPAALRAESVMPALFSDDERGAVERYAVATFLAGQGGSLASAPAPPADVIRQSTAEGEQLFWRLGCAVCHERQGEQPARATLAGLGQKTTPEALEAFLAKPSAVAPAGRMPDFVLGRLDKHQLAIFLAYRDAETARSLELPTPPAPAALRAAIEALPISPDERTRLTGLNPDEQLLAVGREVMRAKNCAACHEIKPAGEDRPWKPVVSRHDFQAIAQKGSAGCLAQPTAPADAEHAPVPRFGPGLDRASAHEFLAAAIRAPAPPAPADAARLALTRLNCLGCHERDGAGGLATEYINRLGSGAEGAAELVTPPSLTQVTAKLTAEALRGVLEGTERARPWMSLQMPRFAKPQMSALPPQLAALDAQQLSPAATLPAVEPEAAETALVEGGRTLVGSRGFGCTKCHDMLGVVSAGTRGPDLANVTARINYPWYQHWMKDPQRIQQGTRMPTVFLNGESPYKNVLEGDPARQREAIWRYLAVSRNLPPPEGLEEQKLQTLAAGNRPLAVRTFLPGTTPRGIAVRFPNQVHTAFDAQTCRLAYAWTGEFLDMGPVWNGRGGHPARLLGATFWTAPAGCPWEVTPAGGSAPSFVGRGDDPALGALVKDSQLHPSRLTFLGYKVDEQGPLFRYRLALDGAAAANIEEHVTTLHNTAGNGLLRGLSVAAPPPSVVWLHVAQVDSAPQWVAGDANVVLHAGGHHAAADGLLRVEQEGRPLLLRVRSSAGPAEWVVERQGEALQVLLRLQPHGGEASRSAVLALWRPNDAQPDTWLRLVAEEMK